MSPQVGHVGGARRYRGRQSAHIGSGIELPEVVAGHAGEVVLEFLRGGEMGGIERTQAAERQPARPVEDSGSEPHRGDGAEEFLAASPEGGRLIEDGPPGLGPQQIRRNRAATGEPHPQCLGAFVGDQQIQDVLSIRVYMCLKRSSRYR